MRFVEFGLCCVHYARSIEKLSSQYNIRPAKKEKEKRWAESQVNILGEKKRSWSFRHLLGTGGGGKIKDTLCCGAGR